jgi:hypothetical protein
MGACTLSSTAQLRVSGVTSGIDLALWLVQRRFSASIAERVARRMEYAPQPRPPAVSAARPASNAPEPLTCARGPGESDPRGSPCPPAWNGGELTSARARGRRFP